MRWLGYLCYNDVELVNENRTLGYIGLGLHGDARLSVTLCGLGSGYIPLDYSHIYGDFYGISALQAGFGCCHITSLLPLSVTSPQGDPAPWISTSDPVTSAKFMGILAERIDVGTTQPRDISQGSTRDGGVASPPKLAPRTVEVTGLMMAVDAEAMRYGEWWTQTVLRGNYDYDQGDLHLMAYDSLLGFRSLLDVVTVDGPTFTPVSPTSECTVQRVTWQMRSQSGWLFGDETTHADNITIIGNQPYVFQVVVPDLPGDGLAFHIEIKDAVTNWSASQAPKVRVRLFADTPTYLAQSNACTDMVVTVGQQEIVRVDGYRRRTSFFSPTTQKWSPGLTKLSTSLPIAYPIVGPCSVAYLVLNGVSGSGTVTVKSRTLQV